MAKDSQGTRDFRFNVMLGVAALCTLILSGIYPVDRLTWALEAAPIAIALAVLVITYRRFRFTRMSYLAMFVAGVLICIGAHWTFSKVPLGLWVKDALHLQRNHYDRAGHFMQGVFSSLLAREIILRRSGLKRGYWLFLLVSSSCLAIAALFEFVEWFIAITVGDGSQAYLATQGDEWDAHWDMLLAFIGAILTQLTFARIQDRQLTQRGLALNR